MKGDAELAATLIGAEQIDQQAYGLSIVGFGGAAPSGGGSGSTKGDERRLSGGDITADGKVVVESGGGGLNEITAESTALTPKQEAGMIAKQRGEASAEEAAYRALGGVARSKLPPPSFSAMAGRASAAAQKTGSRGASAEQGV
ncbi:MULTISPECIES: hypothetical protein [unclassified Rhizobium]|uniref:hypothetical protein n=1 Tax=unclassified Rhizobium TaxID=2613769 RepID=UPI0007E9DB35|nr:MULTISPECIES: hypothetical protein [unclassified Rhizobium]ANL11986.1 hypothetical protein AMJ98_PA00040 [Rhizobium sp. N1341]ANM42831.1 hypothetical protein AMK03_PA00040 [Rhizobium sp. N741]